MYLLFFCSLRLLECNNNLFKKYKSKVLSYNKFVVNLKCMKKIFLSLVLVLCFFTFVGCSSASGSRSVNTSFSSIYMIIDCDSENLTEIGVNEESEIIEVKNTITDLASEYVKEIRTKYVSILNDLKEEQKITQNEKILYKNHLTPYVGWDKNTYVIEFRFYSQDSSRLFIKYGSEFNSVENEQGFWATSTKESFSKLFSDVPNNLIATTVIDYYTNGVKASLAGVAGVDAQNFSGLSIDYLFLSTNSRLHSDTADISEIEMGDGHLFCFNDNGEEIEFSFYTLQANRLVWYLLALAITMIFVAVYLAVIYFKKEPKPKIEKDQHLEIKINDDEDL